MQMCIGRTVEYKYIVVNLWDMDMYSCWSCEVYRMRGFMHYWMKKASISGDRLYAAMRGNEHSETIKVLQEKHGEAHHAY